MLTQIVPNSKIHWISWISEKQLPINEMSRMVAAEISKEIDKSKWIGSVKRVSFISHSLGGIIIRGAIEYLKEYKNLFGTYISLATPHLGYFHSTNKLLSLGLWVVNGITRDQLLSEIRLSDDKDIQETSLYKLSSAKGLEWFDVVVFTGSSQDWYSPIESALIQMSDRIKDSHIYADLK